MRMKMLFNLLFFSLLFTYSQAGLFAQDVAPACGDPGINFNDVDKGTFVYFDCNNPQQYHIRTTAGQTSQIHGWMAYEGRIETSGEFIDVTPFDIETEFSDEVISLSPAEIYFKLNVSAKQIDGLDFKVQQNTNACLEVSSLFAPMPVFLGATRRPVGNLFNLRTGQDCSNGPQGPGDDSLASIIKQIRPRNLGISYYFIYQGKYQFINEVCRDRLAAHIPEATVHAWTDVVDGRENRLPKLSCDDMIDIVSDSDPEPQICDSIDAQITADITAKINAYKSRAISCPARVSPGSVTGITPEMHGAIGNGFNDDTLALNNAIEDARSNNTYLILNSGSNYLVSNSLVVTHGIKGIVSSGSNKATISTSSRFPQSAVILLKSVGQSIRMSDVIIQNVNIVVTKKDEPRFDGEVVSEATVAIFSQPADRLGIYDNAVSSSNKQTGGIYAIAYNNHGDIEDVCIEGNTLTLHDGGSADKNNRNGIFVRGNHPQEDRYDPAGHPDPRWDITRYWSIHHKIRPFNNKARRIRVDNNDVTGGYYGIALINTDVAMVTNNTVKNNTRNIRWGAGSNKILVDSNNVSNSASASFLNAYGSHDHVITRNTINTARASKWGMIEMSLGTDRNTIAMNTLISPTRSPSHEYGIYAGPHANNNLIFNNTIRGHFSKSYIALEGSHAVNADARYHRNGDQPLNNNPTIVWQSADSVGNQIVSNNIAPQRLSSPLIFLSQTSVGLRDTTLKCNAYSQQTNELIHRLELTRGSTSSGDQANPWR